MDHWMIQSKHSILGEFYSVFGKCVRSVIHSNRRAKAYLWFRKAFPFKRCVHRSSLAGLAKTCPFTKITRTQVSIPVQDDFLGRISMNPGPFLAQFIPILAPKTSLIQKVCSVRDIFQFKPGRTRKNTFR